MSMGMSGSAEKEVYVWINRVVLVLLFFFFFLRYFPTSASLLFLAIINAPAKWMGVLQYIRLGLV